MSDETPTEKTPDAAPEATTAEPVSPEPSPLPAAEEAKTEEGVVAPAPEAEPQADGVSDPAGPTSPEPSPLPAEAPGKAAPAADPASTEAQPVAPESPEPATPQVDGAEAAPSGGDGTEGTELPQAGEPIDLPSEASDTPEEGESAAGQAPDKANGGLEGTESAGEAAPSPEPSETENAPSGADEPIIAQVRPEGAPLYNGQADPSPPPDLGDQEALPHPALTGHNPGFIAGATESTQGALPVPGIAGQAAAAAQAIQDAGSPRAPASTEEATEGSSVGTPSGEQAGGAPPSTPAVPTAAHVPCAFQDLTGDTLSQLEEHDEGEVKVLQLELQGLANIALALVKRIEALSAKKALPKPIEGLQSSAQTVVDQALDIFETSEGELSGFESASADLILSEFGED